MATFIPNVTDIFPQPKLYTPDFSFIDKMLKRKEAQYEQGFAQLNNQYSNINRAVTHDFYGKQRDQFLNDAKVNLKNLSAMDLSDPQNVREATNVFKPIYSNTGLLADQALTAHWNRQLSTGESLRLKDGGKEYSEDNMNYIRLQMQAYKNDDPSTVTDYYTQKKSYTPYYDYHKEVQDAMKEFKPSHTKLQEINGMWLVTSEDKSYTELELQKYLNGVLSDKAKQQMRIEGAVRLGTNENFLMNQYTNTEGAKIPEIGKLIDKIDAQLKTEKDPNKIAQLKANKDYYDDQRTEINNNLKNIRSGDMSFLKKNSEALAFGVYYDQVVNKKVNAFEHKDISQTYDINQVAKMYWENEQDWAKIRYKADRDDDRELKKAKIESMKGITDPITVERAGDQIDTTLSTLNQTLAQDEQSNTTAYENLKDVIANANKISRADVKGDYGLSLWNKYIQEHPKDKYVVAYMDGREKMASTKLYIQSYKTNENAFVKDQMGTQNYEKLQRYNQKVSELTKEVQNSGGRLKIVPANVAATNLGFDVNQIKQLKQMEIQLRKGYNAEKQRLSVKNQTGFTLGIEDPRTKAMMSKIAGAGILEATDVIGGPQYFYNADGKTSSVSFAANSKSENFKTPEAAQIYINRLKARLGVGADKNVDIVFNPLTYTIDFKGMGNRIVPELDPYNMVPPKHRDNLKSVENFDPNVGGYSPDNPFRMEDIDGKPHFVNIKKYKPGGSEPTSYNISIDGRIIDGRHFDNTIGAYLTLQNMMASPFLNQSLNAQ
jgi:hypothetical protein